MGERTRKCHPAVPAVAQHTLSLIRSPLSSLPRLSPPPLVACLSWRSLHLQRPTHSPSSFSRSEDTALRGEAVSRGVCWGSPTTGSYLSSPWFCTFPSVWLFMYLLCTWHRGRSAWNRRPLNLFLALFPSGGAPVSPSFPPEVPGCVPAWCLTL